MEDIRKILAVSWVTQYCKGTVHFAVSLATKYGAELAVIHVIDTSWMQGWNLPMMLHEERCDNSKDALLHFSGEE